MSHVYSIRIWLIYVHDEQELYANFTTVGIIIVLYGAY